MMGNPLGVGRFRLESHLARLNERVLPESLTDCASRSPINRWAGNREQLPQVADQIFFGSMHEEKLLLLFVRKLRSLALQFPLGTDDRCPLARTQSNKVGLKLRESSQDVEEHLAHRIARIVATLTERERDGISGEFIGYRARVWNGAGEPVQLRPVLAGDFEGSVANFCIGRRYPAA